MDTVAWYRQAFGEDYLSLYRYALNDANSAVETRGIMQLLNLPDGARILDLCCGTGRHAVELARRGHLVTGLDLSNIQLREARDRIQREGVPVELVEGDMRDLPFGAEFDVVINMFNSFGYLESDEEDQKVLNEVARVLKPAGKLLQQIPNREAIIRAFQPMRAMWLPDGSLAIDERTITLLDSRLHLHQTKINRDGTRVEIDSHQRLYSLTEMARKLETAGLVLEWHGGRLNGSGLDLDSTFLVVLAAKHEALRSSPAYCNPAASTYDAADEMTRTIDC